MARPTLEELKARAARKKRVLSSGYTGSQRSMPVSGYTGRSTPESKTTLKRVKIQGRTAAEVARRYGVAASSIKKRGDSFILPKTASLSKGTGTRSATAIDRAASADKQRSARYVQDTKSQKGQSAVVFRRYTKKAGGKFGPGMAIQGMGKPGSPKMKALAERARQGGYTRNYKEEAAIMKQQASTKLRGERGGMRGVRGFGRGEFPGRGTKVEEIVRPGKRKVTGETAAQQVAKSGKRTTKGYGKRNKPQKSGYGKTRGSRFFVRTGRGSSK